MGLDLKKKNGNRARQKIMLLILIINIEYQVLRIEKLWSRYVLIVHTWYLVHTYDTYDTEKHKREGWRRKKKAKKGSKRGLHCCRDPPMDTCIIYAWSHRFALWSAVEIALGTKRADPFICRPKLRYLDILLARAGIYVSRFGKSADHDPSRSRSRFSHKGIYQFWPSHASYRVTPGTACTRCTA